MLQGEDGLVDICGELNHDIKIDWYFSDSFSLYFYFKMFSEKSFFLS